MEEMTELVHRPLDGIYAAIVIWNRPICRDRVSLEGQNGVLVWEPVPAVMRRSSGVAVLRILAKGWVWVSG